jgi:hypothetical protein
MEPFITYLTVFKSRLGLVNILLDVTGLGHQPSQALLRKLRHIAERKEELALEDPANFPVFQYLVDKQLISPETRSSGRYRGFSLKRMDSRWKATARDGTELSVFPVFEIDRWMSAPIPSTIGAPTPENVEEVLQLGFQMLLISRTKNTWTAAGHTIKQLRGAFGGELADRENPFLLGLETPGLLRQVVRTDGQIIRELLREVVDMDDPVSRDAVAERFALVVDRVLHTMRELRVSSSGTRKAREFADLIRKTTLSRSTMSRAPGVLEHRVSPRLEWLTDLGYLSKRDLPKNGFEYRVEPHARDLLRALDANIGAEAWADSVAIMAWNTHPGWVWLRAGVARVNGGERFRAAYSLLRRPIGPVSLREAAFVSALLSNEPLEFETAVEELIQFAGKTDGVSLSGGRYRRSPENIYMTDKALGRS